MTTRKIIYTFGVFVALLTGFFILKKPETPKSPAKLIANNSIKSGQVTIDGIKLTVEIADTAEKKMQGLSGRYSMMEDEGMIFIFTPPAIPGFWMKDMNFPLDMIWIDANWHIVGITKNIPPDSFPKTFNPPSPIVYVIEVNAGWTDKNNISIGDKIDFRN